MAFTVNLLFSGLSASVTPKKRSYVETYQVLLDAPSTAGVVADLSGLPFFGKQYPGYPSATCTERSASPEDDTRLKWIVNVTYETQDSEQNENQKTEEGELSDNPFDWRDRWEWIPQKYTVTSEDAICNTDGMKVRPKGKSGPAVNAAGDVFDPGIEKDVALRVLRVTKVEKSYPSWVENYENAINSDSFSIRKIGLFLNVKPFTAKMEPVQASLKYHQPKDGVEISYVEVVIEIVIKFDGWRAKVQNRGLNRRQIYLDKTDNGQTIVKANPGANQVLLDPTKKPVTPILDTDKNIIGQPALLDLNGQPLPWDAEPLYIEYLIYPELPFANLNI